nr:TonB-dependent receptor [Saprospiraceae bacterium]
MRKLVYVSSLILFCLVQHSLAGQTIQGEILDENDQGMIAANVYLMTAADTTFIRGTMSNDDGTFIFEKLPAGNFLIQVTSVGYNNIYTAPIQLSANEVLQIEAIRPVAGLNLKEVVVTEKKPLYQAEPDGLVVNVENSIVSAGATALEILERSPGVVVDRQNNTISLVGKQGVNVMINGKLSYMPIASLVQFLEGMSADNIKSIKLITVPPARFDAEGNAGYIDIRLRRRTDEGLSGTLTASYGYGRGHVSNDNLSFNYRKNRLNLFGNYSFVLNGREQLFQTIRTNGAAADANQSTTAALRDPQQRNHNLRLGLDYQLSDQTIVGGLISAYDNKWSMNAVNTNEVMEGGSLTRINSVANVERNQWKHYSGNLNIKHNFTENEFVTVDLDYLDFNNENPTQYTNSVFDGNELFLRDELTNSTKITPINIWVGKADYHRTFSDRFSLDVGGKIVRSSFDNRVSVEMFDNGEWVQDPTLSSNSNLGEQIWAAYASSDIKIGEKTNAKVGLRYEYTDSKLDTETDGRVVDRQFGRFFPSAFLGHDFTKNFGVNLAYSRRITRPTFNEMAPFVYLIDPSTFFAGNVAIQPSLTDAYKLDLRYKTVFFSVQYSMQDSTIARFQQQYNPETDRLVLLSENLKNSRILSFTLGFPLEVNDWWQMRVNAMYFQQQNNTYDAGKPIQLKRDYLQFNTSQSFKLPHGFSSELSLFYIGPRLAGALKFGEMYGLNLGFQKNLGGNRGTL